ncbi:hypothetical protein KJ654_04230, partial [Patescibacteria group bacterium]|nr:hypothetical protein [Patescibacteria group bacterium]
SLAYLATGFHNLGIEFELLDLSGEIDYFDPPEELFSFCESEYWLSPRIFREASWLDDYLPEVSKKYDAIFFDLGFTYERRNDKKYSFCAQKFTLKQLKKALTPQGIIIYVVIARRQCHQKQFLCELYQQFKKFFNYCELYSDEPQNHKKIQSHVFILNQKNMQNNKPFTKLNKTDDRWSNLYQELKGKQMNASVLT